MKIHALLLSSFAALCCVDAYMPKVPKTGANKSLAEFQKAIAGTFAACTIASSVIMSPPPADAVLPAAFSSSQVLAEKVIREGVYGEYEVDVPQQVYDDARSTFKPAKETKSKKGKYTALLAVLIVGSFVIPMAQYFWYVRDDDSSDKFFAQNVPEPEPEKKKKRWF